MSRNEAAAEGWTPAIPFTPSHVSVNRVRIAELPGLPVDPEVRGQLAYHLVSVFALAKYARERAEDLALPPEFRADSSAAGRELPRYVDACLLSANPVRRAAAQAVAVRLGRNLGHILLALHRGDGANRAARDEWSDADWTRWAAIKQVWLAGGLMSGELGRIVADTAQSWLGEMGYGHIFHVRIDPLRQNLVLHGAARHLPPTRGYALALDFGQTSVKRGIFAIEHGSFRLHRPLLPVDAGQRLGFTDRAGGIAAASNTRDFIAEAVAGAWSKACELDMLPLHEIIIAVAAYVEGGRLLGNGPYAAIHALGPDARPILSDAAGVLTGTPLRVYPIHDGTAAAAMHAGEADSAVLVAGTALGIGFPQVDTHGLLDLAPAAN